MNQAAVSETAAWLPVLPNHWGRKRFKLLFRLMGGGTPSKDQPEYWIGDVPWVSSKDMKVDVIFDTEDHISEDAVRESATNVVPEGTILIVARSGILRHTIPVAITGRPVAINQDIKAAIPRSNGLEARYFAFLIKGFQDQLLTIWRSQGATVESLDTEIIGITDFPVPPLPEQRAIADFLDREVAKIDALIAKQEELIEQTEERRRALALGTLLRGSREPRTRTYDSPAMTSVPTSWSVAPLRRVVDSIVAGPFGSSLTKDEYAPDGYRVYGQEQVIPGDFNVGDYFITPEKYAEMNRFAVKTNDVLVSCVGTYGRVAIVPDSAAPGIINPRLVRVRAGRNLLPEFLACLLKSEIAFSQFEERSRGGTMDVLNASIIADVLVPVPPIEEQEEIVADFAEIEKVARDARGKANAFAQLMTERRSALITAAVTGQIEVAANIAAEAAA